LVENQISFFGDLAHSPDMFEFEFELGGLAHVNLEAPLIRKGEELPRINKVGPHLRQVPDLVKTPAFRNFTYSLANNHTMDYSESGLKSTLSNLPRNSWAGAGFSLQEARKPLIIQLGAVQIGIISAADVFFGAASLNLGGFASVSAQDDWVASLIRSLRQSQVIPIVSFHGGLEDSTVPSPLVVTRFRKWVDEGAELVIGHHPHVPLPSEKYNGKWIFYGLGNFLVDVDKWRGVDPLSLISRRVDVRADGNEVSVESHHLQLRETPSPDGLKVVSSPVTEVIESDLNLYFADVLNLVDDQEKFGMAFDFLAHAFAKNFGRRQLLLGSIGNFLPLSWRRIISDESVKGLLEKKLQQGFGPHLQDLFQGEVSRQFLSRGLEILSREEPQKIDDLRSILELSNYPSLRALK
jgi:hypothetical protein